MGLDFLKYYGGCRLRQANLQPSFDDEFINDEDTANEEKVILDYETPNWQAVSTHQNIPFNWQPNNWQERPIRFIDGKDVGQTIAWVRSPQGQLVPIRLSQIGSISMRVENGNCHREFHVIERVVSMEADLFPWTEIEGFAAALQAHGFRLLTRLVTRPPDEDTTYDFEKMRQITQNRTRIEMQSLEEAAIAYNDSETTLIDGPLNNLRGGFEKTSPVIAVIKKPRKYHLRPLEKQLLYQLEAEQRTPVFCLPEENIPAITWYLRLSDGRVTSPSEGIVRVEICQSWFENYHKFDWDFVNKLSQTIYEYRCRERSYDRAAVSLHPIVRGEESLGSLFDPLSILTHRFYRLTEL